MNCYGASRIYRRWGGGGARGWTILAGSHSFQTEGVSRLRQSIKGEGTVESWLLITHQWRGGEGRGGRVIRILQSLLKGSGKFYPETTKNPLIPLPPQAITKDHSFNRHSSMTKRLRSKRLFEWNLLQNRTPWCNCKKKRPKVLSDLVEADLSARKAHEIILAEPCRVWYVLYHVT